MESVSSASPDGPAAPGTRGQPWSQEEAMEELAGDPIRDGVPERVVQATIRLLAEQGPSAIKARTVASASGLSTMAVYHHFGGIAELIGAVADRGFTELDRAFSQVPVTEDPVADLFT